MPHHKSAVKRMRTAKRDRIKNTSIKSEIKSLLKKAQETPANKEIARLTVSKLDRRVDIQASLRAVREDPREVRRR